MSRISAWVARGTPVQVVQFRELSNGNGHTLSTRCSPSVRTGGRGTTGHHQSEAQERSQWWATLPVDLLRLPLIPA
jgi:hypothetical protein